MHEPNLDNLNKTELVLRISDLRWQLSERTMAAQLARYLSRWMLAITIVLIPFRYRWLLEARPFPPIYKDYTDFLLFASDAALIATLALWLLAMALRPVKLNLGPLFLTLPLAGLVLFSGISAIFSIDQQLSIYHTIRLAMLLALYLYVIQEIKDFNWVYIPAGIGLFIQSSVGIIQTVRQKSIGLTGLVELALDPNWKGVSIVWAQGIRTLRAYGLSDHPNILGGCLAFGLLLIAGWYLANSAEKGNGQRWLQTIITGLFGLGCTGLLLTFSRSAWIAFLGGGVFLFLWLWRSRQTGQIRGLFALTAAGLIITTPLLIANAPYLGVRLNAQGSFDQVSYESKSINERKLLNSEANQIFSQHALTGTGIGAYTQALRLNSPIFPIDYQPAHFALLAAAADIGIFGALSYMTAMIAPWLALALLVIHGQRRSLSLNLAITTALLLAVTAVGFFDYYTWLLVPGRLWQWLAWGLWAASYIQFRQGDVNV